MNRVSSSSEITVTSKGWAIGLCNCLWGDPNAMSTELQCIENTTHNISITLISYCTFPSRSAPSIWNCPVKSHRNFTSETNAFFCPFNDLAMLLTDLPKPKKRLRWGSTMNSHELLWSMLVGKVWGTMLDSSILVGLGWVPGKLLIAFSKLASRVLTSVLHIKDNVATLAAEEVELMTCAITWHEMGTMGGTRSFGHLVKKDWREGCDCWVAFSLLFFLRVSWHTLLLPGLCCFQKFGSPPIPTLTSLLQTGHRTWPLLMTRLLVMPPWIF